MDVAPTEIESIIVSRLRDSGNEKYMERKCSDCYYVRIHEDRYGKVYRCHRYPLKSSKHNNDGVFPTVRFIDWCGEWRGKK